MCPICKDETEQNTHVPFSCKGCDEFRHEVKMFEKAKYTATFDISYIMSVDDEVSVTR